MTGLYYKMLQKNATLKKKECFSGTKLAKDGLMIVVCSNASGTYNSVCIWEVQKA